MSPSMRREWIEMITDEMYNLVDGRLPPCGGSGLKSKYTDGVHTKYKLSPSMRREWIEITKLKPPA